MSDRDLTPILKYAEDCLRVRRAQDLAVATERFFTATPVTMSSYHHYPPVGSPDLEENLRVFAVGFPQEYVREYYRQKMWRIDPFTRIASTMTGPFFWSDVIRDETLTQKERDYLAYVKGARLGDGLGVPVFGPRGRNGYCGLGFEPRAPRPDAQMVATIHWACQVAHLAYCNILSSQLPAETSLSAREKEILGQVARGHTNSEIADQLQISRNTVETYIRRCFDKLDVTDRVSAALRGMALGMVD